MTNPRFILIGGFLGAGKTTLISRLARHFVDQGKRVAIVTNDQADDLVDTRTLRAQGFEVGEVAGACFCCNFDELLRTAESLSADCLPDVILAEPVGSCTDLVSTVILPLEHLYGEKFEIAPFGVLLKPSHGQKILGLSKGGKSGFSPQAEYIFIKQLEEAQYVMIGRADQLRPEEIDELREAVRIRCGELPVISVSPLTGEGLEAVVGCIETCEGDRTVLEIDYDIYAAGEAELGWVNLTSHWQVQGEVDLDHIAVELVARCRGLLAATDGEVAHLKCVVSAHGTQAVANLVSSSGEIDRALKAERSVEGPIQVIVNARVAIDPEQLTTVCREAISEVSTKVGAGAEEITCHSLRPGRPVPKYRMTP